MRITSTNKDSIEKMHLFSGESKQVIRNFFESLVSILVLNYMEGETMNIPFLGDVKIKYNADEDLEEGEEVKISIEITPDNNLLKNIIQVELDKESDVEKMIKMRIRDALKGHLSN